jgi:hypothetical protein
MTEAEWLAATDPAPMLRTLPDKGTPGCRRRLRLFAASCCRRHDFARRGSDGLCAVEVAELLADGLATNVDRKDAVASLRVRKMCLSTDIAVLRGNPLTAARECAAWTSRGPVTGTGLQQSVTDPHEAAVQASFLRDIFGNPFRPVSANPAWLTPTVVALAEGIYADRAFDRMPILTDALQDAGCDHTNILAHCRGPGPHVRGCWVVDLVLGKS